MMKLFKALCWAALSSFVTASAAAQVVQPTYVRPSKGTEVGVFPLSGVSPNIVANTTGSYTSAIYDMTAFAEAQLTVVYASVGIGTQTRTWSTSQFGRYIRIIVFWDNTGTVGPPPTGYRYLRYTVESSSNTTSGFRRIDAPGDDTIITGNPTQSLLSQTLTMTPIPFQSLSYTRPSKGETLLISDLQLAFVGQSQTSPYFSWAEFAAANINVVSTGGSAGNTCRYNLSLSLRGSPYPSGTDSFPLTTPNASRVIDYSSDSYAVNIAAPYVRFSMNAVPNNPTGPNCFFKVYATPLPYTIDSTDYP